MGAYDSKKIIDQYIVPLVIYLFIFVDNNSISSWNRQLQKKKNILGDRSLHFTFPLSVRNYRTIKETKFVILHSQMTWILKWNEFSPFVVVTSF